MDSTCRSMTCSQNRFVLELSSELKGHSCLNSQVTFKVTAWREGRGIGGRQSGKGCPKVLSQLMGTDTSRGQHGPLTGEIKKEGPVPRRPGSQQPLGDPGSSYFSVAFVTS